MLTSYWAIAAIVRLAPADIPRLDEVGLNVDVPAFAILIAAATAVVCGLARAIPFWRHSIEGALRSSGRSTAGVGTRFRAVLVAGQTALAVVLLIGSGLLMRGGRPVRSDELFRQSAHQ
jgi:hypothetical protein